MLLAWEVSVKTFFSFSLSISELASDSTAVKFSCFDLSSFEFNSVLFLFSLQLLTFSFLLMKSSRSFSLTFVKSSILLTASSIWSGTSSEVIWKDIVELFLYLLNYSFIGIYIVKLYLKHNFSVLSVHINNMETCN